MRSYNMLSHRMKISCLRIIMIKSSHILNLKESIFVVVVDLLFYVHGKHLRSCRDGQLT